MALFQYTGYQTLIYFKYLDREAGHTLVADPGGQYEILATESDLAVPPGDGRWAPVSPPPSVPEPEPEVKLVLVKPGKGNISVSDAPVAVPDLIKPEVKPEPEPSSDSETPEEDGE